VAALRATEKGYRVGVMESGRRWPDEEIPKTSSYGNTLYVPPQAFFDAPE
jgi:hypothetical protein